MYIIVGHFLYKFLPVALIKGPAKGLGRLALSVAIGLLQAATLILQ